MSESGSLNATVLAFRANSGHESDVAAIYFINRQCGRRR
jgi:hypothetical protein